MIFTTHFLMAAYFICACISLYYLGVMYKMITTKDPVILYSSRYSCLYFTAQALVSIIEIAKAYTIYKVASSTGFIQSTEAARAALTTFIACFDKWTVATCLCCSTCIVAYAIRQNFGPSSKIGNWYCVFEALFSLVFIFIATLAISSTSAIRIISNPIYEITDTNIIRAMFYTSIGALIWLNGKQIKGLNAFTIQTILAKEDALGKRTVNLHISRTKFRSALALAFATCIATLMHSVYPLSPILRGDLLAAISILLKPVVLIILLSHSNKVLLYTLSQVGIYE